MQKINENETIWAEKYRPQTLDDMILPDKMIAKFREWIANKDIPHIGFVSDTPGTGKTSINKILAREITDEHLFINASKDGGINTLRDTIINFVSSVSINGDLKIVSLSEADGLTGELQKAIRDVIDSNSQNCRFILTCNYIDRIIEPILTRISLFDFDKEFQENKVELSKKILDRLEFILKNENVKYNIDDLKKLIIAFYPCVRNIIIVMQQNTVNGELTINEKSFEHTNSYIDLTNAIKEGNFKIARQIISGMASFNGYYRYLYKNIDKIFTEASIQQAVIIIQHYFEMAERSRDKELTISALSASLIKQKLEYL